MDTEKKELWNRLENEPERGNRFNELMTVGYEAAMRSLEEMVEEGGMRPAEAIQITRLHLEAIKAFGVAEEPKTKMTGRKRTTQSSPTWLRS